MSNRENYNEEEIKDKKVEETWSILKEIENAINIRTDIIKSEKEIFLIRKFQFALTNTCSDRLLIIENEEQSLQCVNFRGTKEFELYNFKVGKTIYIIHINKMKRLIHHGQYDYESKYWYEAVPARLQILDLSKDGDTISVEFLFNKEKLLCKKKVPSNAIDIIPRVIGKINLDSISEWLIYLYNCDIINDNIGMELKELCESGMISDLDSYLDRLCEEFSSYLKKFTSKSGDWLKLYLLLYANITNNLLVITDDSDDIPEADFVPDYSVESPLESTN